jgi:catechol 2,3-dioxygenase-like lactoylglutathione lyase family enzyme
MADPMMVGAATVFVVSDIEKSVKHYRDVLGFTVTFQYGNPTFYVCLCRDEVALHLLAAHETKRLPGNGGICVFVRDVDGVHAELAARGASVIKGSERANVFCCTSNCGHWSALQAGLFRVTQPDSCTATKSITRKSRQHGRTVATEL